MPFAPGMYVFPGGGVADEDYAFDDPLRACAVRETFEEVSIAVGECRLFDRWVTPESEERRYDVAFFVADVTASGRLATSEADHMAWLSPHDALEQHHRGDLPLLRPTRVVLEDLAAGRVDQSRSSVVPKLPRMKPNGLWDVIDADSGRVIVTVEDGPTITETRGLGGAS